METPHSPPPSGAMPAPMREGTRYMIAGAILLVLGFFCSVFCFHSNVSMDIPLYGMTGAGLSVLMYGLYKAVG